ncbi:hypothetical protein CHARACLAT_000734 [Characodon lateralis]|uniref:Uncharacterized protein n=1 Tax=Characodon lateralis TaxID=208331 RepID=A0ABU7CTP0_9TELE|nr:hypothetical protein [Characodon lateralis]
MDSPWCPVLIAALAVCLCFSPAVCDRKFGCLFEEDLCAQYEFCVSDGVFGRCQDLAGAELYTYDISSSALQRLRILLQNLAHRGTHSTPNLHLHPQVVQRPAPPRPLYRAQNHGGQSFLLCCSPALE